MPSCAPFASMTAPRAWAGIVVGVLGAALLLGACGGGSDAPTAATPPKPQGALAGDPVLLEGRAIYGEYCASCHGVAGEGAPGPAFVGRRLVRTMPTAADEAAVVRAGRAVMPSFGKTLTPEQLDAVVRYTREVLAPRAAP